MPSLTANGLKIEFMINLFNYKQYVTERKIMYRYLLLFMVIFIGCSDKSPVPKTLLFSPITPEYLRDTAVDWKSCGFDGFLLSGIMRNWADDIWATDGDSLTRNADDQTFQRVKACNDACRKAGIEDNFIKIAFYSHVPLWTNNDAWKSACRNFYEAARFARETGCRGIALDIEYVSEQYEMNWEGYDYNGYTFTELQLAAVERGRELVRAMLDAFPDLVFLNLPEGITYYGPLAANLFSGMLQAMAEANAPGGMFLLTEASYDMTSTLGLIHYARSLSTRVEDILDETTAAYWENKGGIVLGGWPLGYYRKILNDKGEFLGWSGKEEKYGNKIVGSYTDKSSRFPVDAFRSQYAGLLLGSTQYCWIYGHGATWWQYSDEDVRRYGENKNAQLPVDKNLAAYKAVVREKWLSDRQMQRLAEQIKTMPAETFLKSLNFITSFMVIGPFSCQDCDNFKENFPPEQEINFQKTYTAGKEKVSWQPISANKQNGYLDLRKNLNPTDWVCAYACCRIIAKEASEVELRLGTNDMGAVWLNGREMLSQNIERTAVLDDDIIPAVLEAGENTVLIKVCNTEGNWGLYLRVTDVNGGALENVTFWPEGGTDNEE
jgi:hypothetical protein